MGSNTIEAEFKEIADWHNYYQSIKELSEREAKERNFTVDESSKAANRRLNRYRDVNPYDHSRIIVKRGDTDYINANLVKMEKANRSYILTQGPLQHTISQFWAMIWEQNSKAILMLNKTIEKKQVKCHEYWPVQVGYENRIDMPDVGLAVELVNSVSFGDYTRRTFKMHDFETKTIRTVLQFHYTTWPDFGIPSTPLAFLQFLKQVRESGALSDDVGPAVVHCSAGIGRSGTFCLVDSCLVLVNKEGQNKVSVKELLLELRRYRLGLIQTSDQLYFSYKAIIEGIKHFADPSFIEYEEVPLPEEEPPLPPPRGRSLDDGRVHHEGQNTPPIKLHDIDEASNSDEDESTSEVESECDSDNSTGDEVPSDASEVVVKVNVQSDDVKQIEKDVFSAVPAAQQANGDDESFNEKPLPPPPTEKPQTNGNIGNNNESTNEVRRRKRQAMEDQIREIKRKQHDAEEAPKKRRRLHKTN